MVAEEKTVSYVNQALMLCWPRAQIDLWAQTQEPPISASDIDSAYAICVERWVQEAFGPTDVELFAFNNARFEDAQRRALNNNDQALAHKIHVKQIEQQQKCRAELAATRTASQADELTARIRARQQQKPILTAVRSK